jgi:parallel beta-helix repeat protein
MKYAFRFLLVAVTIALPVAHASAAQFFLAVGGSDANPGSIGSPFGTLNFAVNQLSAGDTLFLRGGVYQGVGEVEIDVTGTAGSPITIRNYQNEVPVLSGTRVIDSGWANDGGGVWKRTIATDAFLIPNFRPLLVMQNVKGSVGGDYLGTPPDPVNSRAAMTSPGTWFFDGTDLFVYPNDLGAGGDANSYTFEIGEHANCFRDNASTFANYLTIQGLTFRGYTGGSVAATQTITVPGAILFSSTATMRTNITLDGCTFLQNFRGFRMGNINNFTVRNCLFKGNIASGFSQGLTNGAVQTGLLIENCSVIDTHGPWPEKAIDDKNPAAMKIHKVSSGAVRGCTINGVLTNRDNDYPPHGIWLDVDVSNLVVENNYIAHVEGLEADFSGGRGIFIERRCDDITIQRNVIFDCTKGIVIGNKNQPTTDWPLNAMVFHNTIVNSSHIGIYVHGTEGATLINNLVTGDSNSQINVTSNVLDHAANQPGGIVANYNDLWEPSPPGAGLYFTGRGAWNTLSNANDAAALSEAAVSGLTNNLHSDPLYQNIALEDFRLGAGSPAIDFGLDQGQGFNAGAPDLGAIEFGSLTSYGDTDADGISDRDEVDGTLGFVTSPVNADTDGDGFNDKLEIDNGTDPTSAGSFPSLPLSPFGGLVVFVSLIGLGLAYFARNREPSLPTAP